MTTTERLNEEDVKLQIVVPYLRRRGFAIEELLFEQLVKVRVGRQHHDLARGFIDIIVSRAGQPLFLIEVKAGNQRLTDDDRQQVLSYAVLCERIPPFALLTNGDEWQLFDVVRKERLDNEMHPELQFAVAFPDTRRRNEALSYLLGCSRENLGLFCARQVEAAVEPLLGSADDPQKKYIPALYVARHHLHDEIEGFCRSEKSVFVLTGDSGSGKTCALCHLALERADLNRPVLFYRGLALPTDILHAVREDFGFAFRETQLENELLLTVDSLLREEELLIIVDGIDEWALPERVQTLTRLAAHLAGRRMKLLVSCKSTTWASFAEHRGQPTGIQAHLYTTRGGQPFVLGLLLDKEFFPMLDKYRAFYNFSSGIPTSVQRVVRQRPVLLRWLCEAAPPGDVLDFRSLDFLDLYVSRIAARTLHPDIAEQILLMVAKTLFDQGQSRVDKVTLLDQLTSDRAHDAFQELLAFEVLEETRHERQPLIGFYFSVLRDYLLAFRVFHLSEMTVEDFQSFVADHTRDEIGSDIIRLYCHVAAGPHRALLDAPVRGNAERYVALYDQVLTDDLPHLRAFFLPRTPGPIGLKVEFDAATRRVGCYGFCPVSETGDRVEFLSSPAATYHRIHFHMHHHSAIRNFEDPDVVPTLVFEDELGEQLTALANEGCLNESNNLDLATETVATIVSHYRAIFSDSREERDTTPIYPIDLARVQQWAHYEMVYKYYRDKRIEHKRATGQAREQWLEGRGVIVDANLSSEDREWIAHKADQAIAAGTPLPSLHHYVEIEAMKTRLDRALASLRTAGVQEIAAPLFPGRERIRDALAATPIDHESLSHYLRQVLRRVIENYRLLIRHNFPRYADESRLSPTRGHILIAVTRLADDPYYHDLTLYLCRSKGRPHPTGEVHVAGTDEARFDWDDKAVHYQGNTYPLVDTYGFSLNSFFRVQRAYLEFEPRGEQPVLRALVYDLVCEEMDRFFLPLAEAYGVSPRALSAQLETVVRN